jgi:PncC family amidohydrolase
MPAVDALAVRVGRALLARAARLAIAESCTGGLVGARVTAIPGSSRYLLGAVVAYHNTAKSALLHVSRRTLGRFGAVSAPVAAAMARGARRAFGAEIAVAVTGIAGPGGATAEKPVGLVYVAVSGLGRTRCRRVRFAGARRRVRDQAADLALIMLLEHLEGVPPQGADPGGTTGAGKVFPAGSNCSILAATEPPARARRGRWRSQG